MVALYQTSELKKMSKKMSLTSACLEFYLCSIHFQFKSYFSSLNKLIILFGLTLCMIKEGWSSLILKCFIMLPYSDSWHRHFTMLLTLNPFCIQYCPEALKSLLPLQPFSWAGELKLPWWVKLQHPFQSLPSLSYTM